MISKKRLPYFAILAIAGLILTHLYFMRETDLEQIREAYISEKNQETEQAAHRVEQAFRAFYQGLRTITQLPGVRKIDRYGKNFQGDSKLAVQQIYNNTYQNVTLSEVYLLPPSLDPDQVDPRTGKPEEPIITFDEFIVGGAAQGEQKEEAATSDEAAESKLEEVEIFEYRLMKKQLEFLRQNYPTTKTFTGLDVPAVTGEPVITCDNSEFTRADLEAGRNESRMGIVYTLPFYSAAGDFAGAVSGVVRVNVLKKLIPAGTFALVNAAHEIEASTDPISELKEARSSFRQGLKDPNLVFSKVRRLEIVDSTSWDLWVALPNSEFQNLTSVKQAHVIFYSGAAATLVLMIAMLAAVRASQHYAKNLEQRVKEKTSELSERNAAMKLVFDHAQEGFMTCGLDGSIGSEYSRAIENWFGKPKAGDTVSTFLFPKNPQKASLFQMGWDQLVEDFMPFAVTAAQMAKYFQHGDRWLSVGLTEIRNSANTLERIMVVVSDVTVRVEAERSDRVQKEIMSVFQHLQQDRLAFIEFFADAEDIVRLVTGQKEIQMDQAEMFRLVHTLKGNCSQYGLTTLSDICHSLESTLSESTGVPTAQQLSELSEGWKDASNRLMKLIGENKRHMIELEESEYLDLLKEIRSGASHRAIAKKVETWKMLPVARRLERMSDQAKSLAARLGIEGLEVQIVTGQERIQHDAYKMFWSAMVHVVRNAVDHGLRGLSGRQPTLSLATAGTNDKQLVVSVKDNGKGIDWDRVRTKARSMGLKSDTRKDLENCIFADGLSTRDLVTSVSGRGIGMAAVKEAVVEAGGSIEIVSEINKGTEFIFTLPREASQVANQAPAWNASTGEQAKGAAAEFKVNPGTCKILVVDDEKDLLDLASDFLKEAGYSVLTSSTIQDALTVIENNKDISAIITDNRMGDERGLELVSKVLGNPGLCQNLIMCSGYLDTLNFDARVYPLSKPFTEDSLLAAVSFVITRGTRKAG